MSSRAANRHEVLSAFAALTRAHLNDSVAASFLKVGLILPKYKRLLQNFPAAKGVRLETKLWIAADY
jgi:hypothetical protein